MDDVMGSAGLPAPSMPAGMGGRIAGQAAGLHPVGTAAGRGTVRVICVTAGKGGVGKSNVSLNLAIGLAELGRRVVLLDADLGLANLDVLLGLRPRFNLSHVIEGRAELSEIILRGPAGIGVIPSASGIARMASLSAQEHAGLIHAFGALAHELDTLIIDTAAGISESVVAFTRASQELLVVVCDEPASLTDAYALIKVMHRDHGHDRFRVICNMCRTPEQGRQLYLKLLRVCDRYLDVALDYLGCVPEDEHVRKAVQLQRAVIEAFPWSRASAAFKKCARQADRWPEPPAASGRLEFFVEQLVQPG